MMALAMLLTMAVPVDAPDPVATALTIGCESWLARAPTGGALASAGWTRIDPAMFGFEDAAAVTTVTFEAPAGATGTRVCTVTYRAKIVPVAIGGPLASAREWLHRSFRGAVRTGGDLFAVNGVTMTRETWQTDRQLVLIAVAQSHPEKGMDLLVKVAGQ